MSDSAKQILTPYWNEGPVELHHGNAVDVLKKLPDESVDCVATSPPYYGHRDYREKNQIGHELKPTDYISRLIEVFSEIKRILKPTGSAWVNIGDSYWSGKGQARAADEKRRHPRFLRPQDRPSPEEWIQRKGLLLVPHRFAIAMQEAGWIVRNDNVWHKPNPLPDPARDRCAVVHEYVFHFVKEGQYNFDLEAVSLPSNGDSGKKAPQSVWSVMTVNSSPKKHTATFPDDLVNVPILATCPIGGVFLDPFCGSATALVVAVRERAVARAIGIDVSLGALDEATTLLTEHLSSHPVHRHQQHQNQDCETRHH